MKDYPEIAVEKCDNHDERVLKLKDQASDMSSWRNRVDACEKLMHLDCQQSKDILARTVNRDPVYKVREAEI